MIGTLRPRRQSRLWIIGPAFLREANMHLASHRTLGRCIYALEFIAGVFLALRTTPCARR